MKIKKEIIIKDGNSGFASFLNRYGTESSLGAAIIILCIVFTTFSPVFFSIKNFINIGIYTAVAGIMATGFTVCLLLSGLDLSQWSVAAVTGLSMAYLSLNGVSPVVIFIVVILIGLAAGAINAFIVTVLKINPIITTLGTAMIYRSFAYMYTQGQYIQLKEPFFHSLGRDYTLGIPNPIWIMLIIYAVFYYILKYTPFGKKVYAVGGNAMASYLSGINPNRVRFGAFMLCGLTSSIAGMLYSSQVGAALPTIGAGAELDVVVGVVLGGIALSGGRGNILGTLLGVLFLSILSNGMTLLNIQPYYQMLIKGLVLIVAVTLDTLRGGNK